MEYIIIENGIIKSHLCGGTKPENALQVPDGFPGYVGLPYAALKDDLSGPKPLSQQISEGIIDLPDGYKVNETDDEFIRMDQSEIDEKYPVKTYAAEGSFESVRVRKTFDRDGNFGYQIPEGLTEMKTAQPGQAYRAENGQWVFDIDKGRDLKLSELSRVFDAISADAHLTSSLGFVIDADETANRDIEGLTLVMSDTDTTLFCDYNNQFHEVTKEQLETMRKEIVANSQRLYQIKWQYRDAIHAAETADELNAITVSFGNTDEKPDVQTV